MKLAAIRAPGQDAVQKSLTSEARSKIETYVREIGSRPLSMTKLTFNEYWVHHYVPRHRVSWGEATENGYQAYFNAYLGPGFGNTLLADIDAAMIATFFGKVRQKRTRWVVLKCWTLLKSILEDAVDDEFLQRHPMRKLPRPKTKIPNKPTLAGGLIARVLDAVKENAFVSAVLHIAAFCAVRTSEVFGLRWRSFRDDHFLIRDSAWNGKLLEDATKTGERRVAIPPATQQAILRWRKDAKDTSPEALMFPSKKGTPMSAHNFHNRILRPLRNKLGLDVPLTFQVLRRSHATRNQRTPKDAQAHLGHRSIVTTMDIYAQEIPASVRQMVEDDEAAVLTGLGVPSSERKPTEKDAKISVNAPKMPPTRKSDMEVST